MIAVCVGGRMYVYKGGVESQRVGGAAHAPIPILFLCDCVGGESESENLNAGTRNELRVG